MGKPKKLSYKLIERDEAGKHLYALLTNMVRLHHDQLSDCRIALAWALSWNEDIDGRVTLGKMKRSSDLDRELHAFDAVILLNADFMSSSEVTDDQRAALIDHELCHLEPVQEGDDVKRDERGRKVYRMRKHDIEEFSEIVERHGLYKRDLERFAAVMRRAKARPLLEETDDEIAARVAADPGVQRAFDNLRPDGVDLTSVTISGGGQSVTLTPKGAH